jgi:cardiolipin synthase
VAQARVPVLLAMAFPMICLSCPAAAAATGPARAPQLLSIVIEPGAGMAPIYRLLLSAHHSLDMTMYELADPVAEADLSADAARGVDVRALLDQNRERSRNLAAYSYLAAHGVHVRWAPAQFPANRRSGQRRRRRSN